MYSSCIFCSHHLGRNETLETFPVGSVVAFDAWKGRLWAVCPHCGRWNLAPIEERWEAVENAEQRFRDTRLRLQSENIGLAQLPEGTRLVRVGDALPGELAAWRYGGELRGRRRAYWMNVAMAVGSELIAPGAASIRVLRRQKEVVYRLPAPASPTGEKMPLREKDLRGARIRTDEGGELQVSVPKALSRGRRLRAWLRGHEAPRGVVLSGGAARDFLSRAMVRVNAPGASERELRGALGVVEHFGSPERILTRAAGGTLVLAERRWTFEKRLQGRGAPGSGPARVPPATLLAFEMLLHEEAERRALAGELRALRERWREAEEIAGIADALLDDPSRS